MFLGNEPQIGLTNQFYLKFGSIKLLTFDTFLGTLGAVVVTWLVRLLSLSAFARDSIARLLSSEGLIQGFRSSSTIP